MKSYPYVPTMVQAITVLTVLKMMTKGKKSYYSILLYYTYSKCSELSVNHWTMKMIELAAIYLRMWGFAIIKEYLTGYVIIWWCNELE